MYRKQTPIWLLSWVLMSVGCSKNELGTSALKYQITQNKLSLKEIKSHLMSKRGMMTTLSRSASKDLDFLLQENDEVLWENAYKIGSYPGYPVFIVPISQTKNLYNIYILE